MESSSTGIVYERYPKEHTEKKSLKSDVVTCRSKQTSRGTAFGFIQQVFRTIEKTVQKISVT